MEPSHTFKESDEAMVRLQTLDKLKRASLNPFIEPVFIEEQIQGAIGYFGSMNLSEPLMVVFPEDAD